MPPASSHGLHPPKVQACSLQFHLPPFAPYSAGFQRSAIQRYGAIAPRSRCSDESCSRVAPAPIPPPSTGSDDAISSAVAHSKPPPVPARTSNAAPATLTYEYASDQLTHARSATMAPTSQPQTPYALYHSG